MIKGTPVWPDKKVWKDCILFIDLSEEAPSPTYLTRCLRNYAAAGILKNLRGLIMGRPHNVPEKDFDLYDKALIRAVRMEAGSDMPMVTCMDFGHTDPICCLPYGALMQIDPVQKQSAWFNPGRLLLPAALPLTFQAFQNESPGNRVVLPFRCSAENRP